MTYDISFENGSTEYGDVIRFYGVSIETVLRFIDALSDAEGGTYITLRIHAEEE